jgi:NAD+ kinase
MKNIVIIPNPAKDKDFLITSATARVLLSCGATVFIDKKYGDSINGVSAYTEFPQNAELIVVIGGDGSIIDASVSAIKLDIPIIGVNLGKVGYLSEVEPDDLEILKQIFTGDYYVDEKMLLDVEYVTKDERKYSERLAVNDIVISHDNYFGIADFRVATGHGGMKYRADGLIISTPAGSTAYSFSAGGPVVSHDVNAVMVTPICAHSFFDRSMLFGEREKINVKNTGDGKLIVSVDGRSFCDLLPGEECTVGASRKKIKILSFKKNNMFSALFKKMKTMEDVQ